MKTLLLLLLTFNAQAVEKDKKLHFTVSVLTSSFITALSDSRAWGFGSCLAVGVGKELFDEMSYGGFDTADLGYDVAGCTVGTYLTYELLDDTNFSVKQYDMGGDTIMSLQYERKF